MVLLIFVENGSVEGIMSSVVTFFTFIFFHSFSMRPGVDQLPQSEQPRDDERQRSSRTIGALIALAACTIGSVGGLFSYGVAKKAAAADIRKAYLDGFGSGVNSGVDDMAKCVKAFDSRNLSGINGRPANASAIADECRDRIFGSFESK